MPESGESREAISLSARQATGLFRAFRCEGAQVDSDGQPIWYFPAGIVLRLAGETFQLSVASDRQEPDHG